MALDTTAVISEIEADGDLLERLASRAVAVWASSLLMAEVLVKPLRNNDVALLSQYRALFEDTSTLQLAAINPTVLRGSAEIRAVNPAGLKLPDAIHLASAALVGAAFFVSNDKRLSTMRWPQSLNDRPYAPPAVITAQAFGGM